jgi:hypothetical protein
MSSVKATLIAALLLTGPCIAQELTTPAASFTVIDERPEADKKQKTYSLMITSCDYGVYRLADKNKQGPGRFDTLRDSLAQLEGDALAGKTLRVPRFDIHFNNAIWMRESAGSLVGGALMESLKKRGVDCPREKMKAGWFDSAELNGDRAPVIVEIQALLDGATHEVRVVYTPAMAMWGRLTKPEELAEVDAAIRMAAAALAAKIP